MCKDGDYLGEEIRREEDYRLNNDKKDCVYPSLENFIYNYSIKNISKYTYLSIVPFASIIVYLFISHNDQIDLNYFFVFLLFLSGYSLAITYSKINEYVYFSKKNIDNFVSKLNDKNNLKCPICCGDHEWIFRNKQILEEHFKEKHVLTSDDKRIYREFFFYGRSLFYHDIPIATDSETLLSFEDLFKFPIPIRILRAIKRLIVK